MVPPNRRPADPDDAKGALMASLLGGVMIWLLGLVISYFARKPHIDSEGMLSNGSPVWFLIGLTVMLVGSALILVGIIGFGVKLGREAARV